MNSLAEVCLALLSSNISAPTEYTTNFHLIELLVWPHEVETWYHSWYRGTRDAKYNLI